MSLSLSGDQHPSFLQTRSVGLLPLTVLFLMLRCHSVDVFEDDCVPDVIMIHVKNLLVLYSQM